EWTDTATAGPADLQRPIHELVTLRAARDSDAPAVVAGDQWLSYGALDRRSSQLANTLLCRGVEPESRVGVLVERSPEMLVTILGILKAGCAYVPLDPAYPTERLAYLIADAEIMLLLTHRGLGAGLAAQSLVPMSAVLDLDRRAAELSAASSEAPDLPARLGQLAYVIYTSGSTGRPKGVAVEHRGLLNLVAWHLETYQVTSADRATQIASLAFDAVVWEIWPYLVAGARLDLADESVRSSADRLGDWLEAHRISLSFLPTPLAEAFLSTYWASDSGSPRWRALLTGGDRLRQRPKAEARLVNHYGPTENSVVATWGPVAASGSGLPTIGRPIANVRVHLLDPELEPVPLGVGGELYLGGASLARGYLGRPRRTAEVFLPDPFAAGHGARLYRTGDLARWQPSGEIDFLGRADHQIKLRGHRIELGEIEATLATHPQVSSAVALLRQDLPGGVGLVAHVVAASPDAVSPETLPSADQPGLDQLSTDQLTRFLRGKLPEFMVPRRITTLDALPLTP
ncbi:MAG: amino acid adenylation domain-containing protein, partial [Acidobacteriota bacterium]